MCQHSEINNLEDVFTIECLGQNIRKQIDSKRPLSKKKMNRVQNIHTEICIYKQNQAKYLQFLRLLVCIKLALIYVKLESSSM